MADKIELAAGGGYWAKVKKPSAGSGKRPGTPQGPGKQSGNRSGGSGGSGKQRVVRTTKGALYYGAPIGTPIVRDEKTGKYRAVTGKGQLKGQVKGAAKKKLSYKEWDAKVSKAFKTIRRLVKQYPQYDLVNGPKKGGSSSPGRAVGGSYSGGGRSVRGSTSGGSYGVGRRSGGSVGGSYSGGARRSGRAAGIPKASMIKTQISRLSAKIKSSGKSEDDLAPAKELLARWRELLELVQNQPIKLSATATDLIGGGQMNAVTQDEAIILAGCSLNVSPKKNWVEKKGGLPPYVCRVARGIMRSGRSRQTAIQMAIGRVKVWAAGGGNVKADTRAKAAKAVAQWEKMKLSAHKLAEFDNDTGDVLILSATLPSFSMDAARAQYQAMVDEEYRGGGSFDEDVPVNLWVKEVWSDFLVVSGDGGELFKVPFEVKDGTFEFGDEEPVVMVPVPAEFSDEVLEQYGEDEELDSDDDEDDSEDVDPESEDATDEDQEMKFSGRKVRTPAGARFYGAPIGTPIVKDRVTGKLKAVTKALDKATTNTGGSLADVRERADSYPGEGSPKNPKKVNGDIEAAALLLSEGKSIRLESEMEVGTLIDKLAQTVEDAKKRGDKAPDYDLCKVSVPGTNLFCAQHKGIPRAKMPQFKGKDKDGKDLDVEEGWRKMLEDKGISVKRKTVPAAELKASQMQLDGPKVAGMSKAMEAGKIPDAPIFVTKDGYILDGHHRWAAKVAIDVKDGKLGDVNMPVDIIDIEIGEAIDLANAYTAARGIVPKGLGKDAEGVAKPPKA